MAEKIIDARNIPIRSGIGKMFLCFLQTNGNNGATVIRHVDDEDLSDFMASDVPISVTSLKRMSLFSFIIFPFYLYSRFGGRIEYISMDYVGVFFLIGRHSKASNAVHDFMYRHIPNYFSRSNFFNFLSVLALDVVVFMSLLRARVWFVSETTSINCPHLIKLAIEDSIVSPPFFYEHTFELDIQGPSELPRDYCLFVGSDRPQKGLDRLVSSLDELLDTGMSLVVIGGGHYSANKDSSCIFLKNLSEKDYYRVLKGARCLLVPSLYEGYCIPVAEAIIHNIPVISSGKGALIEWDDVLIQIADFGIDRYWIDMAMKLPSNVTDEGTNNSFIRSLKAKFINASAFLRRANNAD